MPLVNKTLDYKKMTTLNERLQIFTQALSEQPERFKLEDLEDLATTLTELAQPTEEEAKEKLNSWFRNHEAVTDAIDNFTGTKEIHQSPRPPVSSEAGIIQNIFELTAIVNETIENKKEGGGQDKSKANEDT